MPLREFRVLFDDQVGPDTLKCLLAELQDDWAQPKSWRKTNKNWQARWCLCSSLLKKVAPTSITLPTLKA